MQLTDTAIKAVNENVRCKNRLALDLDRAVPTIERWLSDATKGANDKGVMLTTAQALQIIREETGLTDEQILTSEKVN